MKNENEMGCERCCGEDAQQAWSLDREYKEVLLDDSHFSIMLKSCPACGQQFVQIFTEFVDWVEGDDKQYWDLLPVTEEEVAVLRTQVDNPDLKYLMEIGAQRRHLKVDDHGVRWAGGGLFIMPGC